MGKRLLTPFPPKSSAKATPGGDILMPGEIEERTTAQRTRDGIEVDETTWSQIVTTAQGVGITVGESAV